MTPGDRPVLLTGASGPIGMAVARRLERDGLPVRATSRRGPDRVDVSDHAALRSSVAATSPGSVVHLVNAPVSDDAGIVRAGADLAALVRSSADAGARRLILASSGAVYGDRSTTPLHEDAPLTGESPYARAKRHLEAVLWDECRAAGVSAVALRIFNVYGPACSASLVNRLRDGPAPVLLVTDRYVRDYVHVDDVADAVRAALDAMAEGVFNVATGVATDNRGLSNRVPPTNFVADEAVDSGYWTYSVGDATAIREALGWAPRRSLADWWSLRH